MKRGILCIGIVTLLALPATDAFASIFPSFFKSKPKTEEKPVPPPAEETKEKTAAPSQAPLKPDEKAVAPAEAPAKAAVTVTPPLPHKKPPVPEMVETQEPVITETDASKQSAAENAPLIAPDTDENIPLPPYPGNARVSMGKMQTYEMGEEDTLLDVARHFRLGFVETRAANPNVDPWTPVPEEKVTIPAFKLLPRAEQKGIVVNLAQMRMYYFKDSKKEPLTFPIGIGREGLQTPTGETTVIRKAASPIWFPTDRMREEKPWLPAAVPAGPSNPLGTHALYLGWPTFLIHGSNKPWAIGRRVSSGCMRMYPEDIRKFFEMVPVGTKVTVVEQPLLVAWIGDKLYLEANPSKTQSIDIEIEGEHAAKGLNDGIKKVITDAAGIEPDMIDWHTANAVLEARTGYPVAIAEKGVVPKKKSVRAEPRFNRQNNN